MHRDWSRIHRQVARVICRDSSVNIEHSGIIGNILLLAMSAFRPRDVSLMGFPKGVSFPAGTLSRVLLTRERVFRFLPSCSLHHLLPGPRRDLYTNTTATHNGPTNRLHIECLSRGSRIEWRRLSTKDPRAASHICPRLSHRECIHIQVRFS